MYAKIFESIYDGTLAEDWRALVTFQQMLVLCDADGTIDMTPASISRRTGIPIEHIEAGIRFLELPDKNSRSSEHEGKRIVRLDEHRDWGWFIPTHGKYKNLRDAETIREQNRQRKQRQREKDKTSRDVTLGHAPSLHTDTDTNTDTETTVVNSIPAVPAENPNGFSAPASANGSKKLNGTPYEQIVEIYHEMLPELPKVAKLTKQRRGYIRQRWLEDLPDLIAWRDYFAIVHKSKFLMGHAGGSKGRPPFRADLMWLCRPENIVKVIEGKYHRG